MKADIRFAAMASKRKARVPRTRFCCFLGPANGRGDVDTAPVPEHVGDWYADVSDAYAGKTRVFRWGGSPMHWEDLRIVDL